MCVEGGVYVRLDGYSDMCVIVCAYILCIQGFIQGVIYIYMVGVRVLILQ